MALKMKGPPASSSVKHLAMAWEVAWREIHGLPAPKLAPRDTGACKSLLASTPPDRLFDLVKAYISLPDKWLRDHAYPLCLLPRNVPAIMLKKKDLDARENRDFGVPVLESDEQTPQNEVSAPRLVMVRVKESSK